MLSLAYCIGFPDWSVQTTATRTVHFLPTRLVLHTTYSSPTTPTPTSTSTKTPTSRQPLSLPDHFDVVTSPGRRHAHFPPCRRYPRSVVRTVPYWRTTLVATPIRTTVRRCYRPYLTLTVMLITVQGTIRWKWCLYNLKTSATSRHYRRHSRHRHRRWETVTAQSERGVDINVDQWPGCAWTTTASKLLICLLQILSNRRRRRTDNSVHAGLTLFNHVSETGKMTETLKLLLCSKTAATTLG